MKRFLSLLLIGVMCLFMFSCGEDEVPDGMKLASDTDVVDYKLFVPESWVVSTAERATTQAYVSNSDRTNITVMQWNVTETTKTVKDWWENEYKPQVFTSGAVKEYTITKNKDGTEGAKTTLDGRAATKYVYTGKIGDSFFRYEIIACVTQGSIYVVQVTYMQDKQENKDDKVTYSTVETHKEAIASIIENFRFE
ncbi:MAG: hypothetical protein IJX02_02940 [Clostridia bacterium]|nr:hypothetical protein [Clostridia bacterium]